MTVTRRVPAGAEAASQAQASQPGATCAGSTSSSRRGGDRRSQGREPRGARGHGASRSRPASSCRPVCPTTSSQAARAEASRCWGTGPWRCARRRSPRISRARRSPDSTRRSSACRGSPPRCSTRCGRCGRPRNDERVAVYRQSHGPQRRRGHRRAGAADGRLGVSGVAFTAHPLTGVREETVITAARGLGEVVVSGEAAGEQWVVSGGRRGPRSPGTDRGPHRAAGARGRRARAARRGRLRRGAPGHRVGLRRGSSCTCCRHVR